MPIRPTAGYRCSCTALKNVSSLVAFTANQSRRAFFPDGCSAVRCEVRAPLARRQDEVKKAFWRKVPEARRSKKRGSASMRQNPRAPANAECFLSRPRPPLGPARLPLQIFCSSHPPPSPSSVDTQRYALGVLSGLRASGLGFPHGDTPARSSSRLVRLCAGL